jgi:hypothetical protein
VTASAFAGSAGIIRAVEDDGGREPKLILELLHTAREP